MSTIIKARKLQVVPVRINGNGVRWIARTIDGSRAAPNNKPYASPEEAVEAAETVLAMSDIRLQEEKASRIIAALEKGRYYIRPREITTPNPPGPPTKTLLFSVYNLAGNVTQIVDRSTFIQAVLDMEGLQP